MYYNYCDQAKKDQAKKVLPGRLSGWLQARLNKIVLSSAAVLLLTGGVLLAPYPAQARLDELIRFDAPYPAPPAAKPAAKPAVPAPAATPAAATATQVYVVREGDSLSAIAGAHGCSEEELARANHLPDSNYIFVGQALTIPGSVLQYRVSSGETLSAIAQKFGVSAMELIRMNRLVDPNLLREGQQLTVPAGQGGGGLPSFSVLPLHKLLWPVHGWVSSRFGMRDGAMHEGLDIAANLGQTVRAVQAGRVVFAGPRGTYGNLVIIDHGAGLRTLYAHNSRLLVTAGQRVSAGQPISLVGSTGRSTGPHVHMEVQLNGVPCDPLLCLRHTNS
ncbi:MAG: M23 family metallopeptidase [Firmicutes bacterium]|nr:M23 family metallopeptidase [Bacillota bacterium]